MNCKVGNCKHCGVECMWLETDGELFEKEVCSPKCLDALEWTKELQQKYEALKDADENHL